MISLNARINSNLGNDFYISLVEINDFLLLI